MLTQNLEHSPVFPQTEVQLCIVHQIRNSLKYVGSANQKQFAHVK